MKLQIFLPVIGIVLFLYIIWNMNLLEILSILKNTDMFYLSISIIFIVPIIAVKAFKWKMLMKVYNIDYPFIKSIGAWLVGYSVSLITPGRLGDFYRAYYLREKTSLGKSLTTVMVDRIIDVIVLFSLALIGIVFFASFYAGYFDLLLSVVVIFILFLLFVFLLTRKGFVIRILRPFFRAMIPDRYKPKLGTVFNDFYKGLGIMRNRKTIIIVSTVLGIIAMLLTIFQYYLMALALNITLPFQFLLMITPITMLLEALPVSLSGIGTRDAALVLFFAFIHLTAESAISFSLVILFVGHILLGIIGMLIWFRMPARKEQED